MSKVRKNIIDDGMNPELVFGADFDGYFGIPIIRKPAELIIPTDIVPFTKRDRINDGKVAVGFYEMDDAFSEILINPSDYINEFSQKILVTPESVKMFISPDCSLYRNAPLAVQISNVYRNRAIGCYFQNNNAYVIPQIRWGNELTYTTIGGKDPQVQMAGILDVRNGKIHGYDNQSGHYKPNKKSMDVADKIFGKLNPNLFHKDFKKGN